jgi:hypothetical protein
VADALFAASMARLGKSVVGRLANAQATFSGVAVTGLFDNRPTVATLGDFQAQARAPSFSCLTADLPAGVNDGSLLTLAMLTNVAAVVGSYAVAHGGRTDYAETGLTTLDLQQA